MYETTIAFSGYFFSFAIQLVLTPVIARLYTPEAYGTFATLNALVMNLSLVLTLGYIDAFQLPKSEKDFFEVECRMMRDDGTYVYVHDRGNVIRNEQGKAIRIMDTTSGVRNAATMKARSTAYLRLRFR